MSTHRSDDALHRAARAVGLHPTWTDNEGRGRTVSPDALRSLIAALLDTTPPERRTDDGDLCIGTPGGQARVPAAPGTRWRLLPDDTQPFRVDDARRDGDDPRPASEGVFPDGDDGRHCQLPLPAIPGWYRLETQGRVMRVAVTPARCPDIRTRHRTGARGMPWGLGAQLYGLRAEGSRDSGLGDFGLLGALAEAAAKAGADALAISPTHALFAARSEHYSPYSPSSRLALNALYADPASVFGVEAVRVAERELGETRPAADLVDWPAVARRRNAVMDALFEAMPESHPALQRAFDAWSTTCSQALRDHALFEALHGDATATGEGAQGWPSWPQALRDHQGNAVRDYAAANDRAVRRHLFRQWLASRGLAQAQQAARDAGMSVGLIADLAVGTDPGGSHVWSRREAFLTGPTVGAPPDALGPDGQNWGLAAFSPQSLQAGSYRAFVELLRANLVPGGGLRIDHVMGLTRLWMIPAGGGAEDGAYLSYPLDALLALLCLEAFRYDCVVIGEDLGTVPPGLREKLSARGVFGMGVLLFEREDDRFAPLHRWRRDAVAYTTTHDLPTLAGWWTGADVRLRRALGLADAQREATGLAQRQRERTALAQAIAADGGVRVADEDAAADAFVDAAIAHVGGSPAPLTLLPLEDITATREQPNLPGTVDEYPNWRRRMALPVTQVFADASVQARIERHRQARAGCNEETGP